MASLYLHIPFCEHKCIYCDFYSIESLDPMESFLKALSREIELYSAFPGEETFETIFFGGGTPSLLSPDDIRNILLQLRSTFAVTPHTEITLETNPGTVDEKKLEGFLNAGVNRLSFGVQSFFDDDLQFLTRIHSSAQAKECIRLARRVGFTNVNLDLIFALPSQTRARWKHNLEEAISLDTTHISAYSLIVEESTPLARMVKTKQVSPLPIELEAEMYEYTMATLAGAGFEHYEVSNYAKPGFRSRHNCNYWNHANYIGFGPSAHSFWRDRRWWNIASVKNYCERILDRNAAPVAGEEWLTRTQLFDETIMLGLRGEGIRLDHVQKEFGMNLSPGEEPVIGEFLADGLATIDDRVLRLTEKGFMVCDEVSSLMLSRLTPRNLLAIV